MVMSKSRSDSKRAETRQFLDLISKSDFFVCKQDFKAWNAPKYWRVYQVDLSTVKYDVSAFTEKKLFIFDKNWAVWEKMKLDEKLEFSRKKFIFHEISKIHQKRSKKMQFLQKKNKVLFCFKITSICRKLISKLVSRSSQSTLCVYEAWNAPKSNPTLLARLKAQKCTFSCKISRILDFQNWKLARLKPVH